MLRMVVHINQRYPTMFAPLQSGCDAELPRNTCLSPLLRSHYTSSYRSEIRGNIAAQLILRSTTRNVPAQYQEVPTSCDNKGVCNHDSQAKKELKKKQGQFNVLHVMKMLISESPVNLSFQWVNGHSVEKKDSESAHI